MSKRAEARRATRAAMRLLDERIPRKQRRDMGHWWAVNTRIHLRDSTA